MIQFAFVCRLFFVLVVIVIFYTSLSFLYAIHSFKSDGFLSLYRAIQSSWPSVRYFHFVSFLFWILVFVILHIKIRLWNCLSCKIISLLNKHVIYVTLRGMWKRYHYMMIYLLQFLNFFIYLFLPYSSGPPVLNLYILLLLLSRQHSRHYMGVGEEERQKRNK